jgi:hypothetical protein
MAVAGGDGLEDEVVAVFGRRQFAVDDSQGRVRRGFGPGPGFDGQRPLGSEALV